MKTYKIYLILMLVCFFSTILYADCMGDGWLCDKSVEKIGTVQNYQGTEYCWFTIVGDKTMYAINTSNDFGKKQYALLIAAKSNGSLVHFLTGGATTPNVLLWGSENNAISATFLYIQ